MTPPKKWLELNQNGFMYLSSQSAPRYPKIWWSIIAHENLGGTTPFAKPNTKDFLQVDQKQHLQLMDTFLQLFHLLWTRTACVLCHRAEASQYEFYVQMVYKSGYVHFIIGVTGVVLKPVV